MENHDRKKDPLALFTDNLGSWHIALLYEEPEHARAIEFQFVRDGLQKGQSCCYIIHENREFIENGMKDNGIDVEHYMKNNMLRIIESADVVNDAAGTLGASGGATKKMCANLPSPFRIVGGMSIRDTSNMIDDSEIGDRLTDAQLEVEHNFHNQLFSGLNGYWLCSYSVNDIKAALNGGNYNKNRIVARLLKSHHGAVFTTKSGKGLSVFMP